MNSLRDSERLPKKMVLVGAAVLASVGVLTLVLRKTVGEYVAYPLSRLLAFIGSLINAVPESGQAAILLVAASILTMAVFLPERKRSARRQRRFGRKAAPDQRESASSSSLAGWRSELMKCQQTDFSAETLAAHIRSLCAAPSVDHAAQGSSAVHEILAGTPTWLRPAQVPSWKVRRRIRPNGRKRLERSNGSMSSEAQQRLADLVAYLARQEDVSLHTFDSSAGAAP
jgi:hypothetical protein